MLTTEKLAQNLASIYQTIASNQPDAQLVAVTKSVDTQIMRQLYDMGVKHLAENRSQMLLTKQAELSDIQEKITWHFVGPLQRRQVKLIINEIQYLHSLDRLSLATEIQKRATHPVKCFVQVNVSGEETKGGFDPEELLTVIKKIQKLDKIIVVGLMTMAPYDTTEEELHHIFAKLRRLQVEVAALKLDNVPCKELSMGMSHDYSIALKEGASFIRVGQAIFQP